MPRYRPHPLAVGAFVAAFLGVAGTAHASYYLSRAQATQAAGSVARKSASGTVRSSGATCAPTDRRPTTYNLRRRWRLWDCSWSVQFARSDASVVACKGRLRLTGRPRGSTYRVLQRTSCTTLSAPPRATPTPGLIQEPPPTATPTPTPPPAGQRQSQMVEQAITYGIGRANELIREGGRTFVYYGQMHRELCQFLNATKVRCPLYVWWEANDTDANFYPRVTREIFQTFVFVEDLGTSVGFNASMEPQSVLSFEPSRPYYMLCSNNYGGRPACPAGRFPVAYPPMGPPFRLS
jgi:hypothetical protein